MSKVLVFGGAGYIGRVLIPTLQEKGHDVTCVDNLFYGQELPTECEAYVGDLTQLGFPLVDIGLKRLHSLIGRSDVIVNLAALVGKPVCDDFPDKAREINYNFVEALLPVLRDDQFLVQPDSNSAIGTTPEGVWADENYPTKPLSLYAETKEDAGKLAIQRGNAFVPRFATVFGTSPRMRMDLLINNLVYDAYFDKRLSVFEPNARRNYLHIKDAVGSIIFAIENRLSGLYNVGNDEINSTKLQLVEKIAEHLHVSIDIDEETEDDDKRDYLVSSQKIMDAGWTPQFSLDDGIKELMMYFSTLPRKTVERNEVIRSMRNA